MVARFIKKNSRSFTTLAALLLIVLVFSILSPRYFKYDNLIDIVNQGVVNGFLAIGITVVSAHQVPVVIVVVLGLLMGVAIGMINGFLITKMQLQPFIATLGTNQIFRGLAYVISNGEPVLNIQGQFRKTFQLQIVRGVRMNMIYLLILAVIFAVILSKRRAGVYIYAIGANESAARMSGINVNRYKMIAYIMCSIGAAMAGMVTLARLGTGEPTAGEGFETMAIAAAAIGGTSLAGGKGKILGTVLGAFTISALKIGLIVIRLDTFYQFIAIGLIIILATYLDTLQNIIVSKFAKRKKA